MEQIVPLLLAALGAYLGLGLLVAVPFVLFGAGRVDPAAVQGTWGFKVLIIPGATIFWPVLLKRWMKREGPPQERSAHREGAS